MKKLKLIKLCSLLNLVLVVLFLTSCGADGENGEAYLSIDYSGTIPSSYWDDNYDIPAYFTWGKEYTTRGGITYSYEYSYSDGLTWYGTNYILEPMDGEAGGTFTDGEDGEDSYCHFYCSYSGVYTDSGWTSKSNEAIKDTTIEKDGYIFEHVIIHGVKDTIVITQKHNNKIISINRRWRNDNNEKSNKPNKIGS